MGSPLREAPALSFAADTPSAVTRARPERVCAEIVERSRQARPERDTTRREGAGRRGPGAGRSGPSAATETSVGPRGIAPDDPRRTAPDDLRRAASDDLRGATPVEPLFDAPEQFDLLLRRSGSAPFAAAFLETRPTASPELRERLRALPPGGGAEAFASVLERPG